MNTGKLDIVNREMERTRVEILGVSELKWTEMGHFQSDEYEVFFCSQDHVRRNGVAILCDKGTSRCLIPIHGKNSQEVDYTHGHHLMYCIEIKSTIS